MESPVFSYYFKRQVLTFPNSVPRWFDTHVFKENSRVTRSLLCSYLYSSVRHYHSPEETSRGIDLHVFLANSRVTEILLCSPFISWKDTSSPQRSPQRDGSSCIFSKFKSYRTPPVSSFYLRRPGR